MARRRIGILIVCIVVIALVVFGVLEFKRQSMENQPQDTQDVTSVPVSDSEENKELAEQIVTEIRKLIDIPEDIDPTVATIVDVDVLRESNPFYNKAENGDHLIVTTDRAILYSSEEGKILDVVPVQLEPVEGGSAG